MFPNGFFGNVLSRYNDVDSVINSSSTVLPDLKAGEFLFCLISAVVLGTLISFIYILTHRKEGYSQSYVMSMVMLPTIVTLILLLVNTQIGAISLAGTLALVRFRSVAGDPKDISYIFFAMAMGVACGMGFVGFAIVFFIILSAVLFVMSEVDFGGCKKRHMTLKIAIPENLDYQGVKTTNFGTLFELIYSVDVLENIDQKKFVDELRALNGNMTINLVFFKYDDKIYEN